MEVTREDVLRCAELTYLNLEEAEIEPMRQAMTQLLNHAASLDSLELEGVEPTTHGLQLPLPRRADLAVEGFTQAEALANAPDSDRGQFRVPNML